MTAEEVKLIETGISSTNMNQGQNHEKKIIFNTLNNEIAKKNNCKNCKKCNQKYIQCDES